MTVLPDGTLRIMGAQKSDSGIYTCKATNEHANDTVTYDLMVLGM